MKKLFFLLFLLSSFFSFSQISVSNNHYKKTKELDQKTLDRFKKTETIFVLPDVKNTNEYEAVLKKYWKITPYQLINYKTFRFKNYTGNKYSFVYLNTSIKTIDKSRAINVYIYANLDLFMLDNTKKKSKEHWFENKIDLARIPLFPKNEFLKTIANTRSNEQNLRKLTYEKNVFYNFNPGFFKNYIQKIHSLLKENKPYHLYRNDFSSEIKNLVTKKLYIPEYLGLKFNGFRETNSGKNIDQINKLFEAYPFNYSIIKNEMLSKMIVNNDAIYYAKYIRINTQRFLHVINANTGEIIYRKYIPGMAYNLNSKQISKLSNAIKKENTKSTLKL